MDTPPLVEINAFTHQGRVREGNEDSMTVAGWVSDVVLSGPRRSRHELTEPLLVAVADGMGGHAAGEVASRYAIKRLAFETFAGGEPDVAVALAEINAEIYQSMMAAPSLRGMGTTLAGLLLMAGHAIWFNIGDSRIYRYRGGKLEELSIGDTRVQRYLGGRLEQLSIDDVPPGPRTGGLTQSLGGWHSFAPIAPHIGGEDLAIPSRWLVCSDGLTDMLSDTEIERAMAAGDEEALRALFTQAMAAGGEDNISIIILSVGIARSSGI
jgi:serine/threonine protein phosphatase PrpC